MTIKWSHFICYIITIYRAAIWLVVFAGSQPKTFKTFIFYGETFKTFIFLRKTFKNLYLTWQIFIFRKSCFSVFLLCRALPIKMYTWEKFWDIWDSAVFSDGRVYGAIRLGMLLDYKKGDRASAYSYPQCV